MSFKNEFKREFNNIKKELAAVVDKTWTVQYEGQEIKVINRVKSEELYIDGQLVAHNSRKSIFSQLMPYVNLRASIQLADGSSKKVLVKLGGLMSLNCIIKVDGKVIFDTAITLDFLPWDNKPKLVPYILEQLENNNLTDDLPDDELLYDENHPKLAAGLGDHLVEKIQTPFLVTKLVKLVDEQLKNPTTKTRKSLYEKVIYDHVCTYGGDFIRAAKLMKWDEKLVHQEAQWLLDNAAHREVVKFALVLLATTGVEEQKDLIVKIGKHEEFTSYAIITLKKGCYHWNDSVFELAKSTAGWGKIAAVSLLNPTSKEIKDWLITDGVENTVMHEALCYPCAVKGDLDVILEMDEITDEQFNGASKIITALLSPEVSEGMNQYAYAVEVMKEYLRHANTKLQTVDQFYTIVQMDRFMNATEEVWENRYNGEWKAHLREAVMKQLAPFKEVTQWKEHSKEMLEHEINSKAIAILKYFGEDVTSYLFGKLEEDAVNEVVIKELIKLDNQVVMDHLCLVLVEQFDFSNLTLDQLVAFQVILDAIDNYEGSGAELVFHGLNHELEQVQLKSLHVLNSWGPESWKHTKLNESVDYLIKNGASKTVKNLAKQILNQ